MGAPGGCRPDYATAKNGMVRGPLCEARVFCVQTEQDSGGGPAGCSTCRISPRNATYHRMSLRFDHMTEPKFTRSLTGFFARSSTFRPMVLTPDMAARTCPNGIPSITSRWWLRPSACSGSSFEPPRSKIFRM